MTPPTLYEAFRMNKHYKFTVKQGNVPLIDKEIDFDFVKEMCVLGYYEYQEDYPALYEELEQGASVKLVDYDRRIIVI